MDGYSYSAKANTGVCIAMLILTAAAVAIRLLIRFEQRQGLLLSDWLAIIATVFHDAYCIVILHFIFHVSILKDFDVSFDLPLEELTNLLKYTFVTEILFGIIITAIKLSILRFYYEIFRVHAAFNRLILVATAICILWFIIATFIIIFQCSPTSALWLEVANPEKCFETPRVLLGYELSNLFIDVMILAIPLVVIGQLQLSRSKKVTVGGIFLLGGFVCIASIVRITAIWNPPDLFVNLDFPNTIIWSTIQIGLGIICACLPTYGPIMPTLAKPFQYLRSMYGSMARSSRKDGSAASRGRDGLSLPINSRGNTSAWVRVGEEGRGASTKSLTHHGMPGDDGSDHPLQQMPPAPGNVNVTREFNVV